MALRIVGGRHRGRRLAAPPDQALRPTADRVREAVFNILANAGWGPEGGDVVVDAVVLDAFCGTGALAFEALSRGAREAWLLDTAPAALALARGNAEMLGETQRAHILRADATRPPRVAGAPAILAFLDPPYGLGLVDAALAALAAAGWLAPDCLCVVETSRGEPLPEGFSVIDERTYGGTRIAFGHAEGVFHVKHNVNNARSGASGNGSKG